MPRKQSSAAHPLVTPLKRTAIIVRNRRKSLAFYRDLLGFNVWVQGRLGREAPAISKLLGMPPATVRWVILQSEDVDWGMVGLFEVSDPAPSDDRHRSLARVARRGYRFRRRELGVDRLRRRRRASRPRGDRASRGATALRRDLRAARGERRHRGLRGAAPRRDPRFGREGIAELAEEYSDHILHVTTRQDIQLHYVHIEDMPTVMRRLAAVGMTTREACGNGVRNLTACPLSGVCRTESFDVTPHSEALFRFLLGHPDCQDFGRKFKIAFSGCKHEA